MIREYRKFLVSKFGKENDPVQYGSDLSADEEKDDKWGKASDFTKMQSSTRPSSVFASKSRLRASSKKNMKSNRSMSQKSIENSN